MSSYTELRKEVTEIHREKKEVVGAHPCVCPKLNTIKS